MQTRNPWLASLGALLALAAVLTIASSAAVTQKQKDERKQEQKDERKQAPDKKEAKPKLDPNDPPDFEEGVLETATKADMKRIDPDGPEPLAKEKLSHREKAVRAAKGELGYREEAKNCNKFSRHFYDRDQACHAWCADFVSWAFDTTGDKNKKVPWGNPSYVPTINAWAKKSNKVVSKPERGDIFTYRNGNHTGLVLKVEGKTFWTVEGNSSDQVTSRKRRVDGPYYFVRFEGGKSEPKESEPQKSKPKKPEPK